MFPVVWYIRVLLERMDVVYWKPNGDRLMPIDPSLVDSSLGSTPGHLLRVRHSYLFPTSHLQVDKRSQKLAKVKRDSINQTYGVMHVHAFLRQIVGASSCTPLTPLVLRHQPYASDVADGAAGAASVVPEEVQTALGLLLV